MNRTIAALLVALGLAASVVVAQPAPAQAACYHRSPQTMTPEEFAQMQVGVTTYPEAKAISGSAGFAMDPDWVIREMGYLERTWRVCDRRGWVRMAFRRTPGGFVLLWTEAVWSRP